MLVSAVCRRWRVEEDFQGAKGLAHLDTGQVTCWTSWHRWSQTSVLASALLAVGAFRERQRTHPANPDDLAMVPVSPRELLGCRGSACLGLARGVGVDRPGSASAVSMSRLYLAIRSPRAEVPDLNWPQPALMTRSAMELSSGST